jgi:lipoprotein-anchoring transpeptidase ErfK/SrfK
MTEAERLAAQQSAQQAVQALQQNNRRDARRLAGQAVRLDPSLEEAWLVLAAVASPEASLVYLKKALEINPHSQKARRGMHWAVQRARKTARPRTNWNRFEAGLTLPAPTVGDTQPVRLGSLALGARASVGDTRPVSTVIFGRRTRPALVWTSAILLALVVLLVIVGFSSNWTVMARSASAEHPIALLEKPSLTPTPTPTNTPTPTSTPTPTPTFTPTSTFTPSPTPTNTPVPTKTKVPPTKAPEGPKAPISAEGRWVDVDLTHQRAYAYENDTLVKTFIVSTGTSLHPTVTGQYHIYVKYRYADMSGPGYYLRDVPYVMYFYKGYGLHGTYWHHNFGHPMSHGCVNMRTDEAGWLFNWADVGTLVNVHY